MIEYCTPERRQELEEKNRNVLRAILVKGGVPLTEDNINLADKMNGHDWYFKYSDDHRKWTAGQRVDNELTRIRKSEKFADYERIWDLFCPWANKNE